MSRFRAWSWRPGTVLLGLRPGWACAAGDIAGCDPAAGGTVQPVPAGNPQGLIEVGRFAETKGAGAVLVEVPPAVIRVRRRRAGPARTVSGAALAAEAAGTGYEGGS